MTNQKSSKVALLQALQDHLDQKITSTRQAIASATESRDSNTKSSAGDKYETGRAMMQQELDKLDFQLQQLLQSRRVLSQISPDKQHERVGNGSLVTTNQGTYLIAFGYGKLKTDGHTCYVISLASPIGQLIRGRKTGEEVMFQNKIIKLLSID